MTWKKQLLPTFLIIVFHNYNSKAANYYLSASMGDDSHTRKEAQNYATPWKTLGKLNSIFVILKPGDSVLFKRGDFFDGYIRISKSGILKSPIVFGAYGTGSKPIINGLTTLSTWSNIAGGIYQSNALNVKPGVNMVVLDGVEQAVGRYPNAGYLTYEAHSGNLSITDNQLLNTPNWTGAEIVLRKNHYIIDRINITSHNTSKITFGKSSNYLPEDGFGYFIQKDPKTLDQLGEWYFESGGKNMQMYFGSANPSESTIKVSVADTLVYLKGCAYLTFDNLSFVGANVNAIQINNSQNIKIQNCNFDFSGQNAITTFNTSYLSILRSCFNHTNNNALNIGAYPDIGANHVLLSDDTIRNTATLAGMGKSIDEQTERSAIFLAGSYNTIVKCVIDSTGYIPIWFRGKSSLIKNNFITNFCFIKDDGGAIWTWNNDIRPAVYANQKVLGNIILNGIGALEGSVPDKLVGACGIYCDTHSSNIEISGNTVANCNRDGILIHNAHEITIKNNTLFNNSTQLNISSDDVATHDPEGISRVRNIKVKKNIFFVKTSKQEGLVSISLFNDISNFGVIDSNYYAQPLDDKYIVNTIINYSYTQQPFTLEGWRDRYGYDIHSVKASQGIPSSIYNIISPNKFRNGAFSNNIIGASLYSPNGNCVITWDNTHKLNEGALKVSYTSPSITNTGPNLNIPIDSISSSKTYLLRFSSLGTVPNKTIFAYIRQQNAPHTSLTTRLHALITNTRTDNEIVFSSPTSESASSLTFTWDDSDLNGTFWIDNIELFEVTVSQINPDDFLHFEYNPTTISKKITLNENYIGVDNTKYSNSMILQPYSSIVLIKDPEYNNIHPK